MWKSLVLILIAGPLALVLGILFWTTYNWRAGVIAACCTIAACLVLATLLVFFRPRFTLFDVFLPVVFSVVWSLMLMPLSLGSDLFAAPAAIGSGLILTLCLWKVYHDGGRDRKWLILPILVYLYEMLPINLPGPFDDYFALSGDVVAAILFQLASHMRRQLPPSQGITGPPTITGEAIVDPVRDLKRPAWTAPPPDAAVIPGNLTDRA